MHGAPRMRGAGPRPPFHSYQHPGGTPQHGQYQSYRHAGPPTAQQNQAQEFPLQNDAEYGGKGFDFRSDLDAKRLRKSIYRKTVDYFTPVVKYLQVP